MHNRNISRLQRNSQIAYFALCGHYSFNGFAPNDNFLEYLPWKFYSLQGVFFSFSIPESRKEKEKSKMH